MNWPDIYLLCFAVGAIWSAAALLLGSVHLGHFHHTSGGSNHSHLDSGHAHNHAAGSNRVTDWFLGITNPSCAAVFLAWFGGVGYLLTRHSGVGFWIGLLTAAICGLVGAWILARFLGFLQAHDQPMNPADYEMVGLLGRVSSTIRPDGVGEVIYVRDGARRPVFARSEDGKEIPRGEEVVVTRYEKGIAYVRTWEAMTQ